jgi:L-alanine-DL-glutamate epimerase-like enolase superfamily enzyme
LRAITTTEMAVTDGHAVVPDTPGIGIAWNRDAMDDRRVA